jgi:hypothetical protein
MGAGAQTNPATYNNSYRPRQSGVDGEAVFLGKKGREVVSEAFLELTIPYNPCLSQRLPAEKMYKLERSPEYLELEAEIKILSDSAEENVVLEMTYKLEGSKEHLQLEAEIESLMDRPEDKADLEKEKRELLENMRRQLLAKAKRKPRKLIDDTLKEWQIRQPHRPADQPEYHHTIFERCRFMMPERDRLATNLFKKAKLRSSLGRSVLRDMMALLKRKVEVDFRPGLEPDKCSCAKVKRETNDDTTGGYDWRHIYNCHKRSLSLRHGFAELCFLCNQWIVGQAEWSDHCRRYLDNPDALPFHFDPLIYAGVLASPGYCPFCFKDERIPASQRMYQYLNRDKWLLHVHRHIYKLEKKAEGEYTEIECPHPKWYCPHPKWYCPKSFQSVLHLQFHLQDIHGIPVAKEPKNKKKKKRSMTNTEQAEYSQEKRRKLKNDDSGPYFFVNMTAATVKSGLKRVSKKKAASPGCLVLPPYFTDLIPIGDADAGTQTSPVNNNLIPMIDLTSEDEWPEEEDDEELQDAFAILECTESSCGRSTPSCNLQSTEAESFSGYSTPLSSVFDDDHVENSFSSENDLGLGRFNVVVDVTDAEDSAPPGSCKANESKYKSSKGSICHTDSG